MGRLVPARAEQLCGRHTAEQRNELTASKFTEFHSIPDQLRTDQPQKKPTQPQKKAKQPASTSEKAHAKRDREAPRTPTGARVSKPAVPKQAPDASQKALEAAPAAVASPRADQQPLNDES